jgi:hypothetical protein
VAELTHELVALGADLAYPETPDLAGGVRLRLEQEGVRSRLRPGRRTVAIGLAAVAIVAGVMAVPQARSAILRLFGVGGVTVVQVEKLPEVSAPTIYLGEKVTRAAAERRAGFEAAEAELEDPDGVYYLEGPTGGQIAFVWGAPDRPRLILSQFRGTVTHRFAEKLAGQGTRVERVVVDGRPALFLSGEPHVFYYVDASGESHEGTAYLARDTLLWTRGGITFRLEGDLSRTQALEIAESVG